MLTPLEKQLTEALTEALPWVEAQIDDPVNKPSVVRAVSKRLRAALTAAEARERKTVAAAGGWTPGPWQKNDSKTPAGRPVLQFEIVAGIRHIADVRVYEPADEANARLIARAPAMDAALRRLLRAFEADNEKAPTLDILTCWETNSQAIAQAQAALA